MKIQNIINQDQLEMLLRLANAMHTSNPSWRYGQSVFNAIQILLPELSEEIRGNSEIDPFYWREDHGARWTKWYATVCPDEVANYEENEKRQNCKYCGIDLYSNQFDTCADCDGIIENKSEEKEKKMVKINQQPVEVYALFDSEDNIVGQITNYWQWLDVRMQIKSNSLDGYYIVNNNGDRCKINSEGGYDWRSFDPYENISDMLDILLDLN